MTSSGHKYGPDGVGDAPRLGRHVGAAARQAEAEAAAGLQRLSLARESLAEEESRLEAARQEATTRLHQTLHDIERERSLISDSTAATARLEQESRPGMSFT